MRTDWSPTGRILVLLTALLACATQSAEAVVTAARTSSFVYDPASGLLVKEIIEPNDSNLCLVTEYGYDAFGNKTSVTTRNCNGSAGEAAAPAGDAVIQPRTTVSTYDAKGQFPVTTTNALGHTETRSFDPRFGGVASLTGPNGLTTSWTYDTFGRKTQETRADGTTTTWIYALYNPSLGYMGHYLVYYIATITSGNAWPVYTNYDQLNRKILTSRANFATTDWIDEDSTFFDQFGRVATVYLPYERAQAASAKTATYTYDILSRVTTETAPNNCVTTKTYAGLTTTVTNCLNQATTTVKNSQGQVASVTDTQGKIISYAYDPFGNLTRTTDALGNVTTLTYDTRGRKKIMNDPDMGTWQYSYDALGELVRQVDAKAQTVTMVYDKLGRMTNRSEPDLVSTWVYDTAAKGIGKLAQASTTSGYSRTPSYDIYGRLQSTSTVIDSATPYVTSTSYDAYGRVDTQTYPTGFAVKNLYTANGYLSQVVNAATPTTVYWTANTLDAMGHLTQQTYGNNVATTQVFDPNTGRLWNQYAGAGNAVQNMGYTYDMIGNLSTRTDVNNNLSETYAYDTLNRLTYATATSGAVNTATTYAYDALGNITCKSDISACNGTSPNYAYNASGLNSVRPHAVAQITGTVNGVANPTYTYDANGNMQSGAGRTTTWTSYNMPLQITKGKPFDQFWYNPEHERIKEVEGDGTTIVSLSPRYDTGIHFEKITRPTGAIEYEHFLYTGSQLIGQYKLYASTAAPTTYTQTQLRYFHKDNLGSIAIITDEAGNVAERLSYDPFGKRRYPNGVADPNGLLTSAFTEHGYTGHEHLDEVGVIHMNGRIYDPIAARFISADPTIQAPGNLQSYNRYSYVINNPFRYTDPSGYCWGPTCKIQNALGDAASTIGDAVNGVKNTVSNLTNDIMKAAGSNPYLGGLFQVGLLTSPFGQVYGLSTGNWDAVGRAYATSAVMAATSWAGGAAWGAYTAAPGLMSAGIFITESAAISYASSYTTARIYGATNDEARSAALLGAKRGAITAGMRIGFEYMMADTDASSRASGNRVTDPDTGWLRTDGARPCAADPCGQDWFTQHGFAMVREGGVHDYEYWLGGAARMFVNAVSKVHDYFNSWAYDVNGMYTMPINDNVFQVYSFVGMPFAAAYTVQAYGGSYLYLNNLVVPIR